MLSTTQKSPTRHTEEIQRCAPVISQFFFLHSKSVKYLNIAIVNQKPDSEIGV